MAESHETDQSSEGVPTRDGGGCRTKVRRNCRCIRSFLLVTVASTELEVASTLDEVTAAEAVSA
jgi:hypothetical protein